MPGQELVQVALWQIGNLSEHIGEPGLGIDVLELGGADEGIHHRRPHAAAVGAAEQPRFSSQSDTLLVRSIARRPVNPRGARAKRYTRPACGIPQSAFPHRRRGTYVYRRTGGGSGQLPEAAGWLRIASARRQRHACTARWAGRMRGNPDAGRAAVTSHRPAGDDRQQIEALERESRELRRANESLLAALEDALRGTQPAPALPRSGRGDIAGAPASPSMESRAWPDETAQWDAALDGEAPWETLLVPRGTSR